MDIEEGGETSILYDQVIQDRLEAKKKGKCYEFTAPVKQKKATSPKKKKNEKKKRKNSEINIDVKYAAPT